MKKKWLVGFICILVVGAMVVAGCGGGTDKKAEGDKKTDGKKLQVYFATGTPGGVYQMLGAGMAKVVNEKNPGYEIVATTPAQVAQSPTMLETGGAALGIGMACMFDRAYNGKGEFEGKAHKKLRSVLGMYDNGMVYLTLKDNPLSNVKDISGKTFASTATNVILVKAVMQAANVDPASVQVRVMSYQQSAEALTDGVAQATVLTGFPRNGTLDSVASTKGVRFLEIDEETKTKFDKDNPLWKCMEIQPSIYTGVVNEKPVWGPTIFTVLYTSADASDDFVYNVTKAIIENVGEIEKIHPAGKDMTLETTARYLKDGIMKVSDMHPGAVKYFKEKGVIK